MHKWPVPSNTSGQFVLQHQHSAANNNSTSVLPPSNGGYPPGGESYSFHGGGGGSMRPPVPLPTMFSVSLIIIYYYVHLVIVERWKSLELEKNLWKIENFSDRADYSPIRVLHYIDR